MICGYDNFAGEKVFEYFRRGDKEMWLRQVLILSEHIFVERQLESGKDKIQTCLRMFSLRGNWNLSMTRFRLVLECFR